MSIGRQRLFASLSFTSLAFTFGALVTGPLFAETPLEYNRDIRPILADNCFACHGADSAARKGDLRLDQRDAAIEAGSIAPGKADESEMIARILSDDPDLQMPPPATKKHLTAEQKAKLTSWITSGAEYQPHWSFIPPQKPELPKIKNEGWVKQPFDYFVAAKLEDHGLIPANEANRRTLARRVSLDLIGLPPNPQWVEEFVNDRSNNAYEKLVDRLLGSVHWGEHRGRYWLDAARYADTHGIHFDNYREIWAYRDWVIQAFNRNLPFDQFTIEQLAGDLLPESTLEQKVASGFNRCNITTNEGGIIDEEYAVLYTRDRTETTGQVWMGLTVGCAVCHDHKFDPISQKEFYELAAFFNNTTQPIRDRNIKDPPPVLTVPTPDDRARWDALPSKIQQAQQAVAKHRTDSEPKFADWLSKADKEQFASKAPSEGLYLDATLTEGKGESVEFSIDNEKQHVALTESATWQDDPQQHKALNIQGTALELPDVGNFENTQAFTMSAWVKLPANDTFGAICAKMNDVDGYRGWDFWVQRRQIGTHIIHKWPGNAIKVAAKEQVPANEWTHVVVSYDGSNKAAGVKVYYNGKPQKTNVEVDTLSETIQTDVPFKVGQRHTKAQLGGAIHGLKIYQRSLDEGQVALLARLAQFSAFISKPADQQTETEKKIILDWWLGEYDNQYNSLTVQVANLEREQADIKARGTVAHVMNERNEEAMAYILFRGEYDQRRDEVKASTPQALPTMPDDLPRNRLGLAQWLLRPEHPLTTRVTVNRFWQQLFGTGLVRSSGDFGITGELPSHPELLDWLAINFRENNWDVKRFFKMLVMSATYRQAAVTTAEKLEKDPDNRLLSRGPRFRMDAEMVRDYALATSGLLVPKIGGPSVKPYQPEGVWEAVAMPESNTRNYKRETGDNLYRRSMYTFWKRSAPPASLEIFNAPSRENCAVRRERTNTPLQALVTLNDPQYIEAARVLAQRVLKQKDASMIQRANFVMYRLLARPLTEAEKSIIASSFADLFAYYQSHPDDAKQLISVGDSKNNEDVDAPTLAAWTMLINQLMNLDEVLNK